MTDKVCYLIHLSNRAKIFLPHDKLIKLGRNTDTQVEDLFVSRNQIECVADVERRTVKVKPVGKSISGVDGYAIVRDKTYILGPGHIIELRLGFHPFEIVFESPDDARTKPIAKKPKITNEAISDIIPSFISDNAKWENFANKELIIFTPQSIQSKSKIAAFDIDGTIIHTKSGKKFPINYDDWVLNYDFIPQKLKKLIDDDYKIVFFTNQSGVGQDEFKIKEFKRKIGNILKKLMLPVQVYVSLGKGIYRKPLTGMWEVLQKEKNDGVEIDLVKSFFVGDAAGREKNWQPKKPKDHSIADRLFALNIGLKFYTPEEYFLKQRASEFSMPKFDPRSLPETKHHDFIYENPNIIIMVGGPGSGKSYFSRNILVSKGYLHINRDVLGSWQKCVKALEEAMQDKISCVIDNTNVDKESRKRYIDVAKKYNVPCRCFVMSTSYEHCKHNNKFREITDKSHAPISNIIINSLKKNYQEPELSEGFEEIVEVPFVPFFQNADHERLYKMFILES